MTQDEVAEKLGVSRPIVVHTEQGKRPVSGLELQRLAYFFARDIREFLADEFAEDDVVHALFRFRQVLLRIQSASVARPGFQPSAHRDAIQNRSELSKRANEKANGKPKIKGPVKPS
jgi:transcriptional regulator with XRE-family HTH domain